MGLFHHAQGAFNGGEFSPYLLGRVDIPTYRTAARRILNWIVRPDGALVRRSGTRFVHEEMDSAVRGRLLPFVFSTEQAYILELGEQRARFYKDEGIILAHTKTFVSGDVDDANDEVNIDDHFYAHKQGPVQLTTTGTLPGGLSTGTDYYIVNEGLTNTPAGDYLAFSTTPGGSKLPIDGTGSGTHSIVPAAITPHEIVLPYTEAELPELHFTQSADVLYIAHQNHHPRTLTRTGHTSWTLALLDMQDGPYLKKWQLAANVPPIDELAPPPALVVGAATGDGVSLTANADLFDASRDVNRMIRIARSGTPAWGSARIATVTDAQNATMDIKEEMDLGGEVDWHLGAWYAPDNWPQTTDFHQQRLGFAATAHSPERIDLSDTDDFVRFAPDDLATDSVLDANAISYKLAGARDVQAVQWLFPIRHMLVGTSNGIWPVLAASVDEAITPTNVHVTRAARVGAARIQPVGSASGVIYVSQSRKKVMFAAYDIALDTYEPENLTLLADHITGSGVDEIVHALDPFGLVWCRRDDGKLAALTLERQQQVWGWHRHEIAGSFGAGGAVVETEAVIPSPNEDHGQLWLGVKRTINGVTKRYVEFLEEEFGDERDIESSFFVDCGLSLDEPTLIIAATQADPVVVSAPSHPFSDGDEVRITHVAGMTELNGKSFTVANKTTHNFELSGVDGTGYSAYVSGGEVRLKVSTISNIGHLEGETVAVLGDGAVQASKVVSGAQITLAQKASEVHLGLGYQSDLETLPLALQDERGTIQGRKQRPTHALLRLHRTLGLLIGDSASDLRVVPFRVPSDPMDSSAGLFTGLYRQQLRHGHDEEGSLYVRKDDPLPATILSIIPTVGVSPR
jgi:hypothetical protein